MDPATQTPCVPFEAAPSRTADALTHLVRTLAAGLTPNIPCERREHERHVLPFLLRLTPISEDGRTLHDQQRVVVGRDISPRGLSFFHHEPLPHRRAIVTLDHPQAGRFTVEVDIHRCRFTNLGWYESGSRLVRAVELLLPASAQAG